VPPVNPNRPSITRRMTSNCCNYRCLLHLRPIALHGGSDAGRLLRDILLASASVPGMFPPVLIRFRAGGALREEAHVDGGVTLPFFIAPAPQDLPSATSQPGPPALVHVVIDGRLHSAPRATRANALSIFSRSISAGLSGMMRTTLEAAIVAMRQRGVSFDYAAILSAYPLRSAFDFSPDTQRSLFRYASGCAAAGRLWTRVQPNSSAGHATIQSDSESFPCPADDSFIVRFAALGD
jgi:hypothetical protein